MLTRLSMAAEQRIDIEHAVPVNLIPKRLLGIGGCVAVGGGCHQ
jgi:hypothetical protein